MGFDSTIVGRPYSRIEEIKIAYTTPMTATVEFTEREHVLLDNGTHRPFGDSNVVRFEVNPSDLRKEVPRRKLDTGELTGESVTYGQVLLDIFAIIRAHQTS